MYYAIRILLAALFLGAAVLSVERARADFDFRRSTPQSVALSVEEQPSNTEYLLFRALELDYDGADPAPLLERAAALNPLNSTPRLRLGLAAEIRGDNTTAEKWLLDAARIDRQFEPRWTLANFYFRQANLPEFWKWMREALEISYADRRPAFDLCWRAGADSREIARAIPEKGEVAAAYLSYLLETRRIDAAAPVALKLAALHDENNRALLLGASDDLIRAQNSAAIDVWRAILGDFSGIYASNFELPRIGHGFDWRSSEIPGVAEIDLDQPPRRRVAFDGREPEACELLRQTIALEPGRAYTLHWQSRSNDVKSGVEWKIGGSAALLSAGELKFTAPARFTDLSLTYTRPPGEPRAEGYFEIWSVRIQ